MPVQQEKPEKKLERHQGHPRWTRKFYPTEILVFLLIIVGGLLISRDLFQPGILLSGDNVSHQAEIHALTDLLIADQHWFSGWYEGDFAGYPLLVYQYPLGKWITAALGLIPGINPGWIYKVMLLFSWMLPALVMVRLLRRRGCSALTLITVSMLYISCFDTYLFSLAGMWNQFLSAGLYLVALDSILKMMKSGSSRQLIIASFWTAAAAVSHQFMLLVFPLTWIVLFLFSILKPGSSPGSLKKLLLFPVLSFSFSAWYFLPIFMTWNWPVFVVNPMKWYNFCSSLFPMVSSDLLRAEGIPACMNPQILRYSLGMLVAAILGIPGLIKVFLALRKKWEPDLLFIFSAGLLISVTSLIILILWEPFSFLRMFTYSVGGGRLALYLLLPLLLLSAFVMESGPSAQQGRNKIRMPALLPILVLLPNLVWAVSSNSFPLKEVMYVGEVNKESNGELRDLDSIFTWLEENADPREGRILYQDTAYNINHPQLRWSHVLAKGYQRTGLWALGTVGQLYFPTDPLIRTQGLKIFGKLRSEMTPEELEGKMRLFNCRWALTCEPELEALFRECPGMRPVSQKGRFSLFKSREPGAWAEIQEGEGQVNTLLLKHHKRILQAEITSPDGALILVKTSFHPWWKVHLNGLPIPAGRGNSDQLLRVRIPESGTFKIELEFHTARAVPLFLTMLGIIAAAGLVIAERKNPGFMN